MKYKHYAPNTKCRLIYFENEKNQIKELENQIKLIKENLNDNVSKNNSNNNKIGIIGFENHFEKIDYKYKKDIEFLDIEMSNEKYAKKIYSYLRKADKLNLNIILIEGVKQIELGQAIMNRLIRTVEYDFITDV